MNKYLTLIFYLVFTLSLSSQIDSTKVSFIAYWSKGDSYNFKVKKIKKRWKNRKLTKSDSTQYIANFKVLDSTAKTYTIQWSYKNNLINTYKKNLNKIYEDKKVVSEIIKKYDVTKIIYKTNEYGEFLDIINWQEISDLMSKMLGELEKSIQIRKPEKLKEVEKAMKPLAKIYSSKDGIEQLILYELQFFHFPFGSEYDINVPLKYEQELPNMVGGKPIKGKAKLSIKEVNFDDLYCVLKEEVVVNPNDTKRQVIMLLKKMGLDRNKTEEIMKTAVFDITDLNYYQYYYDPGIPHRVYGSRKTKLNMDTNSVENLEELEIELVYKE
jgi:hypothetical protein